MSKRMSIINIYNIYIYNIYLKTKKIKRQVVNIYIILPIIILLSNSNNWDKTLKELTTGSYEYKACKLIIYKESSYNPKAVNGSHYGLAQGRSEYLKTATPQQQIKWFTKYVYSRYGSCRAALAFHLKNGYY